MSVDEVLLAVRTGQLSTVKSVLARGELDRNLRDAYGATCLHLAARSGNLDLLKFLVEIAGHSTIATAQNGALPSHDAAAAGHQGCLEYLLRWGCPEDARDHSGATVLHLSARFGHLSLLRYLVDVRGMSIRDKDSRGVGVLHFAAAKGDLACLMYIVTTAPDMANDRTDNGATPSYFAVQNGHLVCLQHLVTAAGANVHLRANDGMQPIHAAAQMGQLHCVTWLVQEQGVLPMERDNDGATPLHFAASRGHAGVVRWLLDNGATCEKDHLGGTPLHDAAEHGQLECAKILVEHGCDVNSEDKDFLVASDLAKKCGHFKVAKFLRSIEKRTGSAKGKGHSGRHIPTDHEAGVYIKQSVSSPTNTSSSLSSSIMSDHESSSSMGTIDEELVDRLGHYEVTESPQPDPDPPYVQVYDKLTEIDPSIQAYSLPSKTRNSLRREKIKDLDAKENIPKTTKNVCSQGTQTDCFPLQMENGEDNKTSAQVSDLKTLTTSSVVSPTKGLQQQTARENSLNSSPRKALLSKSRVTETSPPHKPSSDKKELRFSTTVMVEEIALREDTPTSPPSRNVQLIPLNRSPESKLQSPPPHNTSYADYAPSPPPLTNSPPPYLQTVTPSRPTKIIIPPPPSKLSPPTNSHPLQNGTDHLSKPTDVSSRLSFITSTVLIPPSPPPPPPPVLTNGLTQSPTTGLSPHLSPSVSGPPSPSDLASVVLKPSPLNSGKSSSFSSRGKEGGVNADLIAEIKAGAALRQTRLNQSMFLKINKSPSPRSTSPVNDPGPKVYYAADFLDSIPLVDESGAELPDWKRRFLAKKEADKANQRAEEEYKQHKQQQAEERKFRDMPAWKVELLRKKEAKGAHPQDSSRQTSTAETAEKTSGVKEALPNGKPQGGMKPWEAVIHQAHQDIH